MIATKATVMSARVRVVRNERSLCVAARASETTRRHGEETEPREGREGGRGTIAAAAAAAAAFAPQLVAPEPALAIGREYGFVEGQIMSLMHPAFMFFLLGSSLYAGYLGFQWRRVRELATEVKQLKAQLPQAAEGEAAPPSPLSATIKSLEEERKGLIGQKLNEKHHNWGSLILGLGTLMAIAGPCNTFLRTGKLFPGPHLYAGAGMVVLWAAAAALVPSMQKGNDTSRSLHIAFNAVNIGLFLWQVPTGLDIVAKVFQFTTLP